MLDKRVHMLRIATSSESLLVNSRFLNNLHALHSHGSQAGDHGSCVITCVKQGDGSLPSQEEIEIRLTETKWRNENEPSAQMTQSMTVFV
jgi:hypothetical protein